MSSLERSWSAFSAERAAAYLTTEDHPSPESREIVAAVLRELATKQEVALLDLGCGNGGMASFLRERRVPVRYTGVDFSEPLLSAARDTNSEGRFVQDDVEKLENVEGPFDVVLYSHVLEMLSSPQASLQQAAALAPTAIVRFFEPPDGEVDRVDLCEMDVGGRLVPYLRRTMSRDYYRLLLARAGCELIELYRCEFARDQVHVLHFSRR
jgi:predicted TPR repeat methyltransferase